MDADGFRRLARSSPWLWRTARLRYDDDGPLPSVRAWIRRPQALRVETLDGVLLEAALGPPQPTNVSVLTHGPTGDGEHPPRPMWWTDAAAPRPPFAPDGLVDRPRALSLFTVVEDAMWQSYRWVALLDPVELADDDDGQPAVDVDALSTRLRYDRETVLAVVRPRDGYDARCSCCPLLPSRPAALAEGYPDADGPFARAHRVELDLATGICVSAREVGGPHDGRGFDVVLEAVDAAMPDELFTERPPRPPRRRGWRRRPEPGVLEP